MHLKAEICGTGNDALNERTDVGAEVCMASRFCSG